MLIENDITTYQTMYNFLKRNATKEEIIALKEGDKDLKLEDDTISALYHALIDSGACDEDIIMSILQNRKDKYILNFIDDREDGYFQVIKVI